MQGYHPFLMKMIPVKPCYAGFSVLVALIILEIPYAKKG